MSFIPLRPCSSNRALWQGSMTETESTRKRGANHESTFSIKDADKLAQVAPWSVLDPSSGLYSLLTNIFHSGLAKGQDHNSEYL